MTHRLAATTTDAPEPVREPVAQADQRLRRLLHLRLYRLGAPQGQGELLRDLLRLLPPGVTVLAHFTKLFFHQG